MMMMLLMMMGVIVLTKQIMPTVKMMVMIMNTKFTINMINVTVVSCGPKAQWSNSSHSLRGVRSGHVLYPPL